MADIKKITLPDGSQYDIKDDGALPKTAGSLNPVTGDLYLTSNPSEGIKIFITDGGNPLFKIHYAANGAATIGKTDTDGNLQQGISLVETGVTRIGANGNNVYIRPNGNATSTGQVYFDTSGQQHGGHLLDAPSTAISDKSLTANTLTELHAFTGLDSSGVYACSGKFTYTPSGTTAHYPEIRISGSSTTSTTRAQNSFYSASSTAKYMSISTVFTGLSRITLYAHTHSSSVTATASDIRFEIVRLA